MIGKLLKLVLLASVLALAAGAWLGTKLPWGDVHLRTTEATAVLHEANGLVSADEKDGDRQFAIWAPSVHWSDGSTTGQGSPPCLREVGREVEVEVGYTTVALPGGGRRHDQVLWLRCP